jgi:hypothetical protein
LGISLSSQSLAFRRVVIGFLAKLAIFWMFEI